ncbi:MAG: diacylglycerol kinase [Microbacteriaceae bacterium]|nr:diacylglycerol kinase [Microbacteriaceae bacterium]
MTKRAAVIYNPARVDLARVERTVAKWEAREGWEKSLWLPTALETPTSDVVGDALGTKVDLVVAAGGDGTVSEVASALRQSGVPLGILPCGTANLLARNLHLPLTNLGAAARIAFTGVDRPVDVGVLSYRLADGTTSVRPYFVMAGFGIDADMVEGTDVLAKKRFGWLAYVSPIVRSAYRTSRASVTWSLDGGTPVSARLHTLIVGNCSTITAGIHLLPGAEIDDGLLDVLAVRSLIGRDRRRFVNWIAPYQGPIPTTVPPTDADGGDTFRYRTAKTVTMTLHDPATFQADGDLIGSVEWAEFSLDPLAVTVKVA